MIGENNTYYDGYTFSLTGRSHVISGKPCQDANIAYVTENNLCFLAVADGVGSSEFSDKGSALATKTLCEYFKKYYDETFTNAHLLTLLRGGFCAALCAVQDLAESEKQDIYEYSTTLTACIYNGQSVVIGHVGDGGVIAVDESGNYKSLTSVQKGDAYNEVYPLSVCEMWSFEAFEGPFNAIVLFTDGVLDVAMPPMLKKEDSQIYNRFFSLFLPYKQNTNPEIIKQNIVQLLQSDDYNFMKDDLSAAAVWKSGTVIELPSKDYLKEPDWTLIQNKIYSSLYPNLNKKENSENAAENEEPQRND